MRLLQGLRGISKLIFIILLLLAFIVGAALSYIWTMGYYASTEFKLPKRANITIEDVSFPPQDTTFFNVTILNPSYSRSDVEVSQIAVLTNDGILHEVEAQDLDIPLEIGSSRTFRGIWNWANYTGQAVRVIVYVTEGSGSNIRTKISVYVKLTVEAYFDSSISIQSFNVTIQNTDACIQSFNVTIQNTDASITYVNITELTINGKTIATENITINGESVSFPYFLNSSESVLFKCAWNWTDYQGQTVTVAVKTLQGYMAKHIVAIPSQ